jgi:3-hydroxyacyl-CoA dehydrogenase
VIGNQGTHFSAGADLRQFLTHIEAKNWAALRAMLTKFQSVSIALRSFERPAVAAVHGYALGGGCEIALGCHEVVAAGETMLGFPEVKVGLIPGAHGTKEMLRRFTETISDQVAPDYFAAVRAAWELIFSGRISGSAAQALDFRLLRPAESVVVMNPARLIGTAKARVLVRARMHRPAPPGPLPAIGATGVATLRSLLDARLAAGEISPHDVAIGTRLADVLCGGELTGLQFVPESYVLELEREAFLGLCGEPNTVARIRAMLETGKPVKN